jgi:hypothetical protein
VKDFLGNPIVVALLTALVMWFAGWARTFLARRVRVSGPEAEAIKAQSTILKELVPAVNILIECKGPEMGMLIALGEAAQGKNNGNVTDALETLRPKAVKFASFKDQAACIEVPNAT